MERRTFLSRLVTATAIATTIGSTAACSDAGEFEVTSLGPPSLLPALGPEAARALGRRYLAEVPRETDAASIEAAVRADVRDLRGMPWTPAPDFDALVRDDFVQGRTIWLDGWLLSRNEARRLGLFALAPTS
jgi:hypothetical protein